MKEIRERVIADFASTLLEWIKETYPDGKRWGENLNGEVTREEYWKIVMDFLLLAKNFNYETLEVIQLYSIIKKDLQLHFSLKCQRCDYATQFDGFEVATEDIISLMDDFTNHQITSH